MKSSLLALAVLVSTAVAAGSTCAAEYVVDACVDGEKAKQAACGGTDYECQCTSYNNILTCFTNCPKDPRIKDYAGQKDIFCGYASQFPSSTSMKPGSSSHPTGGNAGATSTTDSGPMASLNNGGTGTHSGLPAATSNGAADMGFDSGRVLFAVGVAAAVL